MMRLAPIRPCYTRSVSRTRVNRVRASWQQTRLYRLRIGQHYWAITVGAVLHRSCVRSRCSRW